MVHSRLEAGASVRPARHQGHCGALWPAGDIGPGHAREAPAFWRACSGADPSGRWGQKGSGAAVLSCAGPSASPRLPKPGCGCAGWPLRPWVCPWSSCSLGPWSPGHTFPKSPPLGHGNSGRWGTRPWPSRDSIPGGAKAPGGRVRWGQWGGGQHQEGHGPFPCPFDRPGGVHRGPQQNTGKQPCSLAGPGLGPGVEVSAGPPSLSVSPFLPMDVTLLRFSVLGRHVIWSDFTKRSEAESAR